MYIYTCIGNWLGRDTYEHALLSLPAGWNRIQMLLGGWVKREVFVLERCPMLSMLHKERERERMWGLTVSVLTLRCGSGPYTSFTPFTTAPFLRRITVR